MTFTSPTTANQTICDATTIQTLFMNWQVGDFTFSWTGSNTLAGTGLTTTNSGTQYIISGTPTTNVTQSTVYTYQIATSGSACSPEVVLNGSIQVDPETKFGMVSAAGTDNQSMFEQRTMHQTLLLNIRSLATSYWVVLWENIFATYDINGGITFGGLPPGLGYTLPIRGID